ncbi:MAG TPA: DUF983 domain-containing protein [Caulobacteraceae bacterium]|nr:DUF983 domain-containing protein [Caulobacteraceae bacterium]
MTPSRGAAPFIAGALGRCPNCGDGKLFTGFLKVTPKCAACGFDLTRADSGDGPAVFVILIAGFVAAFGLLLTEIIVRPPIWVEFVIWLPVAAGLSLGLLQPLKGLMIAAQFVNKASEAGRDDI